MKYRKRGTGIKIIDMRREVERYFNQCSNKTDITGSAGANYLTAPLLIKDLTQPQIVKLI